jgi:hypothetical protein
VASTPVVNAEPVSIQAPEQAQAPVSSTLSREKVISRGFTKVLKDKDGKYILGKKTKQPIRKVIAKSDSSEAVLKRLKDAGWEPFNSNAFIRYKVKSTADMNELSPVEQQPRIFQAGVSYLQSTKSNAMAIGIKEETGKWRMDEAGNWEEYVPAEPEFNDQEIDLRDSINTPSLKKRITRLERLLRSLYELPLPEEEKVRLAEIIKLRASASPEEEEEEEEVEAEAEDEDEDETGEAVEGTVQA